MKLLVTVSTGLASLRPVATIAIATPLQRHEVTILDAHPDVPGDIVFRNTTVLSYHDRNDTAHPTADGNVTACNQTSYDDASPRRTSIVRDDCEHLALQLQASAGFWELDQWGPSELGLFKALASFGTCEFAVQRLGGVATANGSETAILGNQDVVNLLNSSVFDFAGPDEYYVDAMRTQGHISCQFWYSANTTIEFKIQYAGAGDY